MEETSLADVVGGMFFLFVAIAAGVSVAYWMS